jgi:hypothetical protein
MAFNVTFTILDSYGRTTTRTYTNTSALIADALSDSATMVSYLEGLSLGAVSKYGVAQVVPVASPAPEALANNDAGATLHCRMENSKLVGLKLPAIDPGLVNSDGTVDLTSGAVTDFVSAFATGAHWRISEGNYITGIVSGELDK